MAQESMDLCLRVLKESNKSRFDSYSLGNSVSYPILPFGFVACTFFATNFLEIAVYTGPLTIATDLDPWRWPKGSRLLKRERVCLTSHVHVIHVQWQRRARFRFHSLHKRECFRSRTILRVYTH